MKRFKKKFVSVQIEERTLKDLVKQDILKVTQGNLMADQVHIETMEEDARADKHKWEDILMDTEGTWKDDTSTRSNRQALMVNATPSQQVDHVGMMQCSL